MANFDAAKAIFAQVDTNRDGSIDQNEFRSWVSNSSALTTSLHESSTSSGVAFNDNATGQAGVNGYEASSQSVFESAGSANTSYAAGATSNELSGVSGAVIQTSSAQQTSEYLSQSGAGIFNDPNPQIVRRAATEGPLTYQQRILVRFLQPPAVPPPGPLIIKEVRPPQPPPPPPLVVRQRAPPLPTPAPLILRERPPVPPAPVASQTVIRRLAAIPVPPRSVIIERLPPLPPKPRDIIIERWVPYGPPPKRRTIVQRAAAAVQYPRPRNIIVVYDSVQARVIRQFQRFAITQEDPRAYTARHGSSLLDSAALVQQARTAGIVEDISPPPGSASSQYNSSASLYAGTGGTNTGFDLSNETTSQGFSTSTATNFEGIQGLSGADGGTFGLEAANTNYSSSSNFVGDSAFAGSVGISNTGFDLAGASFAAADTNHDGRLDQAEFQRFIQGGI